MLFITGGFMKKTFKILTALILALTLCLGAWGCTPTTSAPSGKFVVSVESTTDGTNNAIIVTYSDGSTQTLTVKNGEDGANGQKGEDGEDLTVIDVYNEYKSVYGDITFDEFLKKYLSFNQNDNRFAIQNCLLSCMKIYTEFLVSTSLGSSQITQTKTSAGSAVIYSMDSEYTYIVTNYHVVYNEKANEEKNGGKIARKIHTYLYGSEGTPKSKSQPDADGYTTYEYGEMAIKCEYIGGAVTADIALLRARTEDVLAINSQARPVQIATGYCVGETAIAIGNAENDGLSVTEGIVSVDNEKIALSIDGTARYYRSIRIDTALYHGNSGGGLFNVDGELIGITNAGNEDDQNINFAIPYSIVTGVVENILYYYGDGDDQTNGAYKPTIGFTSLIESSSFVYNEQTQTGEIHENVIVVEVLENTFAQSMGLLADDYIKAITLNGEETEITRDYILSDLILTLRPGDTIALTVKRGEETITLTPVTFQKSDFNAIE